MAQYTNQNRSTVTITADTTSDAIHIKDGISPITIGLHPGTSGKIQYTISAKTAIVADTANWVDWDVGDITEGTIQVAVGSITGVRGVAVTDDAIMEIVY